MDNELKQRDVSAYENGHIKLHRSLLDSSLWMLRSADLRLAMYLLLKVNWKDREWFNKWQRRRVKVRRGELITSLEALAIGCRETVKTIRTSLKHLIDDGFLEILNSGEKRARQFTHLRVCKYSLYQDPEEEAGTARARHGHGTGTARATTEEINKMKKGKNERGEVMFSPKESTVLPSSSQPIQLQIYFQVTGRPAPAYKRAWILEAIGSATAEDLRPFYEDWCGRTTKGGGRYNPNNPAWLERYLERRKRASHTAAAPARPTIQAGPCPPEAVAVFDEIKSILREHIPPQPWKDWVRPTTVVDACGEEIRIKVPNELFVRQWEERFLGMANAELRHRSVYKSLRVVCGIVEAAS